jgi:hypothetical protein
MIDALAFVASNALPEKMREFYEKSSEVEAILDNEYHTSDGYRFPFNHFYLTTHKK